MRASPSLLAVFLLVLAVPSAAQLPPKGTSFAPGAKPVARPGTNDDGVKPVGPRAALGSADDTLLKANAAALTRVRRASFLGRDQAVKGANERLSPSLSASIDKGGIDRSAFQKQVEACVAEREPQARAACTKSLKSLAQQKLTPVLQASGIDVAIESGKLRSDFGFAKPIPRPNDPGTPPELVFESTASMLVATVVPFTAAGPLPPSNQLKTAPFVVLDAEGDDLDLDTRGSFGAHCGAIVAGACYKRVGLGGRFYLAPTMRSARARIEDSVMGSAMAAVLGGYGSAEAKVSVVVRRHGAGEVCREERSLARAVAPIIGVADAVLPTSEIGLSCTFAHDGSNSRYDVAATVEVWAGNGGLGGASAVGSIRLSRVTLDATATPQ